MFRVLELGPVVVQGSLIVLLASFWIALDVSGRNAKRYAISDKVINNGGTMGLFAGITGARIGYALMNWSSYQDDLHSILSITPQAFSTPVGLIVGGAAFSFYAYQKKAPLRALLDALAPGTCVLIGGFALAHLADGTLFGTATNLPVAIHLWGADRHPTQIYALIIALLMLTIWWRWGREMTVSGGVFLLVVGGNALGWLFTGLLIAEPQTTVHNLRSVQVIAWLVLVTCAAAYWHLSRIDNTPENL